MSDESLVTSSQRGRPQAVLILVLLFILYVLAAIDRQILSVIVDPLRERFALSDARFALLAGFAFSSVYAIAAFPAARLADRRRRTTVIAGGLALWSLCTGAFALARSSWQLFLCRMGVGLGEACLSPAAVSLLADCVSARHLGKAVALYVLAVPIGNGMTGLLGSALLDGASPPTSMALPVIGAVQPWQALLLLLCGLGLLLLFVFVLTVREPARRQEVAAEETSQSLRAVAQWMARHAGVFGALALVLLTSALMYFGLGNWIPSYFIRGAATENDAAALLFYWGMIGTVVGALGVLAGGFLTDYLCTRRDDGLWRTLGIGTLLLGFGYSAFALAGSPQVALLLLVPGVFGNGILQAAGITAVLRITPNHMRGQVSALYFLLVNLVGAGLGPLVVTTLGSAVFGGDTGLGAAMASLAFITCAASLYLLLRTAAAGQNLLARIAVQAK